MKHKVSPIANASTKMLSFILIKGGHFDGWGAMPWVRPSSPHLWNGLAAISIQAIVLS
jgi:hypothetical protein